MKASLSDRGLRTEVQTFIDYIQSKDFIAHLCGADFVCNLFSKKYKKQNAVKKIKGQ